MPEPKPKKVPKLYRDVLAWQEEHAGRLVPGDGNPLCKKCGLDLCGSKNPYLNFCGPEDAPILVVFENVSGREDDAGQLGAAGFNRTVLRAISRYAALYQIDPEQDIRTAAITLCSPREGKLPNFQTKGNWCKWHLVQEIARHRPALIIPVGTVPLGLLSHKSNAQDWQGRTLTYRGWPDDWLTEGKFKDGHPVFGAYPDWRIPMVPIQTPRLAFAGRNQVVLNEWGNALKTALRLAAGGVQPLSYARPWFELSTDPAHVESVLRELIAARTEVTYDTETTGVTPFTADASIVFMMFRWKDARGPRAFGFPWRYDYLPGVEGSQRSPLLEHLSYLTPLVLEALYASVLRGHNLTFDVIYTYATLPGADLHRLTGAMQEDTWHMLFTLRQKPGSLGLELLAYDWAGDMAGYEEDMTLLIDREKDLMAPWGNKGGHYANCPPALWDSHLKPYVMGDVEVCHVAASSIREALADAPCYKIPLASLKTRGRFRLYAPAGRELVYDRIMSPAASVLTRIMARGMHVDLAELSAQEDEFPKRIREAKLKLRQADPRIVAWCDQMEATEPGWELDLEKKEQLRTILFDLMELPVNRLTKNGRAIHGEDDKKYKKLKRDELLKYAAVDKFTLNAMSVPHPELRVLLDYRKVHKLYSTYIRPIRNIFTEGIDKKERKKVAHLMIDGRVHAQFKITGTRSGRLASSEPNLTNLPKDGEVKAIYASRFGNAGCMYHGDMSQIELRLLAAVCGDASMVDAYIRKLDLHSLTTEKIFGIPYEHFGEDYTKWLQDNSRTKEIKELGLKRRVGKTTNFLTGYGGGALGLMTMLASQGIYLPLEECEDIIDGFFRAYPTLKEHISLYKAFINQNGCAVSLFGRVRIFDEIHGEDEQAKSKAQRAGYNHLVQSTASDMMLLCLCAIETLMREESLESMLVSTVHDSLLIDARRDELDAIHAICSEVFDNIPDVMAALLGDGFDLSWMALVPFAGDVSIGRSYLEEKKVVEAHPDWERLLSD